MKAEPEIVLCSYCQCSILQGADDLYEVLLEGIRAPLCACCYKEYEAGNLGGGKYPVLYTRRENDVHAA